VPKQNTILIVDDEEEYGISVAKILNSRGYSAQSIKDPLKVSSVLNNENYDLLIMDIKMPGMSGIDLLKNIKNLNKDLPIIMVTGFPSIENAVTSMKYGAMNFFTKPIKPKDLLNEISKILSHKERYNNTEESGKETIITKSTEMLNIMANVRKVSETNAPVLILGESGTGKELIANILHNNSSRKDNNFVKVNCAAIPENLLESELFGHEKGAFTDAMRRKKGKFELADNGTIFLDEIGDMSQTTQAKILRVLQEKEFQRVGGNNVIKTDARLISATNKDLGSLIEEGLFREDLFYRLSVVTFELPPLRERRNDIMPLASYFLDLYNRFYRKSISSFSDVVKMILLRHKWPGNIRELKNCIERAVIFCEENVIHTGDLPAQYREKENENAINILEDLYRNLSRDMISEALKRFKGNKQKTSEYLNITRKTLYNKMKKLGLE